MIIIRPLLEGVSHEGDRSMTLPFLSSPTSVKEMLHYAPGCCMGEGGKNERWGLKDEGAKKWHMEKRCPKECA
jgi:hypothetical protein